MRRDVLTGEMLPKKSLVRIVRDQTGAISIDPSGKKSGRGAYVSLDPEAVKTAKDQKTIDRAFDQTVAPEFYDELFAYVDHQKARQELFGSQQ
ncbi:hypothetical protein FC84_GL001538 [Lapidilactobacillus dextrinicus DSM 20335]|uniref:YlxR domain-containing protein n=2 Tax=Lapidilactobacillus dextrinicus TaxID=51664 RepID=A0A0R2BV26_9LACO|nr:hypothetical protein FC84_GL001538 [Lapidilactobacillus dextrinicus DSM 20335]